MAPIRSFHRARDRPLSEGSDANSISHRRSSVSEGPRDASPISAPPAKVRISGKTRAPTLGGGLVAATRSPSESLEEYDDDYAQDLYDEYADDDLDASMTKWHDIHQERLETRLLELQNTQDDSIEQKIEAEQSILHAIRDFLEYIAENQDVAGDVADDVEMSDAVPTRIVVTEEAELDSDEIEGLRELDHASGESSDEQTGDDAETDHEMTDGHHAGDDGEDSTYNQTPTPADTLLFDENAANHEVVQSIEDAHRDDEQQRSESTEQGQSDQRPSSQSTRPAQASTYTTTWNVDHKTNFPDPEDLFASSVMARVHEIQKLDWDLEQFRAPPLETQDFASIMFREKAMAAYAERELRRQDIFRIIENGEAFEQESMLAPVYEYSQLFDRFEYYCAVDFEDKQSTMMYGYEVPAASHALQALPISDPDHKAFWEGGKTMLLDRDWYLDEIHRSHSLGLGEIVRIQSRFYQLHTEAEQFCALARANHSILALSEAHTYRNLYEWGSGKVPELIVAQRCLEEIKREVAACRNTSQEKTSQLLFEFQEQRRRVHQLTIREGHYALTGCIPYVRPYEPAPLCFEKKQKAKEIKRES